ncbi:heparin/heparin-sulfate lyase HepB [Paenibacillus methanolicus]|uniref:Heparinase II/III-like protein n=1 Tax=Paenibacillus methanolicus TaxID=582686 RepID=A0A5S5CHX2_9BACL|nr:heparin/heparin-sulfate lyase HepB [Paenibacillus methanolicus]TYP79322.1 heparinase II/III-like protein [Paenibacillus methanolicus]
MSKSIKWLLVLLLLAGLLPQANLPAAEAAVPVALANPGFESGLTDWSQYGTVDIAKSSTMAHSESKSLQLEDNLSSGVYGRSSKRVAASPGNIYRASVASYLGPGAAGALILAFYNSINKTIHEERKDITGDANQWNNVTVTYQAPPDTVYVGILLVSGGSQTGNVYFDDAALEKSNVVGGHVTLQSTNDPLGWAKLSLYRASDMSYLSSAYADKDGAFKLAILQSGSYIVRASRNGYVSQSATVQVVEGEDSTVNFALAEDPGYPVRAISGTVTGLTNGQPIAGATVGLFLEVDHEATDQLAANATTDVKGSYSFPAVAPSDRYFVKVEKPGYVTTREPVYVYDESVTDANVQLPIAPPAFDAGNVPKPPTDHPRLFVQGVDIPTINAKRSSAFFEKSFETFDNQLDHPGYTARSELSLSANQVRTFTFPAVEQARYIRLVGRGNIGMTNAKQKGISISEIDVFMNGASGVREPITSTVTATNSSNCADTAPGNAVDNILSTYSCNTDIRGTITDHVGTFKLDLQTIKNIHSLDIIFYKDTERVYLFDIEVSQDNTNWKLIDLGMGSSDMGTLPAVPANSGNVIDSVLNQANANAFAYLLDPDQAHANGEKAVAMALHIASSARYPATNNNAQTGSLLETMALVYDWCHGLLDADQKGQLYNAIIQFAEDMEMRYISDPLSPKVFNDESLGTGHGAEGQLFRYLLGAAIAVYDEYPDLYNRVVPMIFNKVIPVRNYFYESESHHQGESYTGARYNNELWMTMLFTKMGLNNPFNANQSGVLLKSIYSRRPDGQRLRDGDMYNSVYNPLNTVWKDQTTYMLASALFDDPYINHEFFETYVPGKQPIYEILFLKDNLAKKSPNDLPLSHYFNDPEASMIARTGWDDIKGINHNSSTVIAEMKIGNRRFGNHEHLDFGSFQLYYKGGLAIDSGLYEGSGGDYGSSHDVNYHKRTIAHNAMLVYDPNERQEGNDGGQRWRDTGPKRAGTDAQTLQDMFGGNYKFAEVQGRAVGPDPITPNYTYIKGDLSPAYTAKVEQHQRSMMFLNLKNGTNPAAMIVFDRVVAADPSFEKYWLLHSIEAPVVDHSTNTTTIRRTDRGDTGKLVNQTLLPANLPNNEEIVAVGGPGHEFDVFGTNYTSAPKYANSSEEQGAWRIQVSPGVNQKEDVFLNVLQVMDGNGVPLQAQQLEASVTVGTQPAASGMVGVQLTNRAVLFSKSGKRLSGTVNVTTTGSMTNMEYVVADLQAGSWKISRNGVESYGTVSEEGGVLSFTGAPGTYTLTRMLNVPTPIANPGFESGLDGWTQYVEANAAEASMVQAQSGNQSVWLHDTKSTGDPHGIYGVNSQIVPASEGEVYRASVKSYWESGAGTLVLVFYKGVNQTLDEIPASVPKIGGRWNDVTVTGKAPAGTKYVGIRLISGDSQTGSVYFDDASLERATLTNPGFESTDSDLYGWTQYVEANAAVKSGDQQYSGSSSILLHDTKTTGDPHGRYGVSSRRIAASPGEYYRASAKSYLESGTFGELVLVFYNSANQTVEGGEIRKSVSTIAGQWNDVVVTGQAPADTAYVGVRVLTGDTQTSKVYFDDVVLEKQ